MIDNILSKMITKTALYKKIFDELGWSPKYDLDKIVETALLWHKNHPNGYSLS